MPIKTICLDLDGLFFTDQSFQTFKERLAPTVEKEKRDFVLALSSQMQAFKAGKMTEADYRERARQELGIYISLSNEEIFQLLREIYEVNPEVEQLAKQLKQQGYHLAICSNNFPTRIRELDKQFSFLSLFDTVILSYEVGVLKPDKKIFEALIQQCHCLPEEIIYSDDKAEKLL
ncbi:MAG: HAD-IA family hydrolase [Candidatus Peribacteria bacterium]|jgi:putative hydrolase of the HAD superfamily|nr:HAD-IA family hydrolase [Candidatus Peribacteria bacterium]